MPVVYCPNGIGFLLDFPIIETKHIINNGFTRVIRLRIYSESTKVCIFYKYFKSIIRLNCFSKSTHQHNLLSTFTATSDKTSLGTFTNHLRSAESIRMIGFMKAQWTTNKETR